MTFEKRLCAVGVTQPALHVLAALATSPWRWVPPFPPPSPRLSQILPPTACAPVVLKCGGPQGCFPVTVLVSNMTSVYWAEVTHADVAPQLMGRPPLTPLPPPPSPAGCERGSGAQSTPVDSESMF